MLTKSGRLEFRFRLAGVQLADRGFYWCDVHAWTKPADGGAGGTWTEATSAESNKVRIDFQENGTAGGLCGSVLSVCVSVLYVCVCVCLFV